MGCTSSKDSKLRSRERSEEQAALLRKILMTNRESQRYGEEHCERQKRSRSNSVGQTPTDVSTTKKSCVADSAHPAPARLPSFTTLNQHVHAQRSAVKIDTANDDHSPVTDRSPWHGSITTPLTNCSAQSLPRSLDRKHVSFGDSVRFNDLPDGERSSCGRAARRKLFTDPAVVLPPGVLTAPLPDDDELTLPSPAEKQTKRLDWDGVCIADALDDAKNAGLTSSSSSGGSGTGSNDSPSSTGSEDDEPLPTQPDHWHGIGVY